MIVNPLWMLLGIYLCIVGLIYSADRDMQRFTRSIFNDLRLWHLLYLLLIGPGILFSYILKYIGKFLLLIMMIPIRFRRRRVTKKGLEE
jgi:hypothetical protein